MLNKEGLSCMPFWISYLAKFIGFFFFFCPLFVRLFLVKIFSWFIYDLLKFRRWTLLKNISIAFPEKTKAEKHQIAKNSIKNLALGLFEFLSLSWVSQDWQQQNVFFDGLENYNNAKNQNKGVLLLSLHLGNGDYGCAMFAFRAIDIYLISKKFKAKWINDFWFGVREKMGVRFIDPHGSKTPFEILSALKAKKGVIFVLDQFMGKPYGIETTFFGRKTGTAYGLALFAIKSKAPVVPVYTYRDQSLRLHVVFDPEIKYFGTSENRDLQIIEMTQNYNQWIEEKVKSYPDQWMWIHRRWKKWE